MDRWQNRVAVVTGAGAGIGAATTVDLLKAGCVVVGLARGVERIHELRASLPANLQSRLHARKCDVSDANSVNETFDWIIQSLGGVDILVNNAGKVSDGRIVTGNLQSMEQVLRTNIMGIINCTQRAFKSMKDRDVDGHVLLINSTLGHQVIIPPSGSALDMGIYPASKFAVTAVNDILRQEFRVLGSKVKITSISPGLVETDFVPEPYKSQIKEKLLPEDVANAVLFAISTPPHVQIQELIIKHREEMV